MTRRLRFALTVATLATSTATTHAGMTSYVLSDVYRLRFQDISFFIFLIVVCAFVFQLLWNYVAKGIPKIPRINFKRALSLVVLLGAAMLLVLTMISGIRELLTPEAWRRQGSAYRLNDPAQEPARLRSMEHLRSALFDYARAHAGKFPMNDFVREIPEKIWESPDNDSTHYLYSGGLTTNDANAIVALEPVAFGEKRFVLRSSGKIEKLSAEEIENTAHSSSLK